MNRTAHQIETFQKQVQEEGLHGKYPRGGYWVRLPVAGMINVNATPSLDLAIRKLNKELCGNPNLPAFVEALKAEWTKQ